MIDKAVIIVVLVWTTIIICIAVWGAANEKKQTHELARL